MAKAADSDDALTAVADELYGLAPGDFTATRNSRARTAKADGDKALGAELARLPKPSMAAWGVNMLVRHRTSQVDQLLELGRTMRAAQADLDSATLRSLSAQRRKVIAAVAAQARATARELGQSLGDGAVEEIEQTLQAAMADARAAEAVRSGRLVRSLTTEGFEPVDLRDAVAVPGELSGGDTVPRAAPKARPPARLDDARRKRRIAEAQRELDDARRRAEEAASEAGSAGEELDDETAVRERLVRERDELEERLEQLSSDIAGSAKRLRELSRARDEAEDAREAAGRDAERAERRLLEAERD
jgi:hypothetical protein